MKPYKSNFEKVFDFGSFEDFALEEFHNGITTKLADIAFGKYFIYLRTPQNALFPCVIYNALLSHRAHRAKELPIIHFTKCEDLGLILQKKGAKAKLISENTFDYAVGSDERLSVKLFYGIKLPFCAKCVENYKKFFGIKKADFSGENLNLWANLFANDLLCALELESLRIESYNIFKAQNYFYLKYKRDSRTLGDSQDLQDSRTFSNLSDSRDSHKTKMEA